MIWRSGLVSALTEHNIGYIFVFFRVNPFKSTLLQCIFNALPSWISNMASFLLAPILHRQKTDRVKTSKTENIQCMLCV